MAIRLSNKVDQLKTILCDQRQELKEIRWNRKEIGERLAELDAKEIEVMVGIKKTKDILDHLGEEYE